MYLTEKRIIRRGVPREEYIQYFKALGREVTPGIFAGPGWEVTVGEYREYQFCRFAIEEEEIIFRGTEEIIDRMIEAFRMKFLRAGG